MFKLNNKGNHSMVIMVTEQLHSAESEANFYTYPIPTYSV